MLQLIRYNVIPKVDWIVRTIEEILIALNWKEIIQI